MRAGVIRDNNIKIETFLGGNGFERERCKSDSTIFFFSGETGNHRYIHYRKSLCISTDQKRDIKKIAE
jgi:hypothetical protein